MKRTRLATPIRKALDFKAKRPRSAETDKPTPSTTTPPNGLEKLTEAPTTPITDQTASPGQTMAEAGTAERVTMIPGFTFDPSFVTNNTNALDPTSPTFDPTADYYTCDQSNNIVLAVYPDGSCAITPNKDDANFVVFPTLDEALNDAYNYLSLIPEPVKARYRKMWGIKADVRDGSLPPGINRIVGESDRTKAIDIPGFTYAGEGMVGEEQWSFDDDPNILLIHDINADSWYSYYPDRDYSSPELANSYPTFGTADEAISDIQNHQFANKVAPHRLTSVQTTMNNNLHYPLVKSMFDE